MHSSTLHPNIQAPSTILTPAVAHSLFMQLYLNAPDDLNEVYVARFNIALLTHMRAEGLDRFDLRCLCQASGNAHLAAGALRTTKSFRQRLIGWDTVLDYTRELLIHSMTEVTASEILRGL